MSLAKPFCFVTPPVADARRCFLNHHNPSALHAAIIKRDDHNSRAAENFTLYPIGMIPRPSIAELLRFRELRLTSCTRKYPVSDRHYAVCCINHGPNGMLTIGSSFE